MKLCALLAVLAGCMDLSPIAPPGTPGGPTFGDSRCGDGVCTFGESIATCPGDCAPRPYCGDAFCEPGETPLSCPDDCWSVPPPPPACTEDDLGSALPLDVTGTTAGAASSVDTASCGDGAAAPTAIYQWTAPSAGRYAIAATGGFAIVLAVTGGDCAGSELACTTASTTVGLGAGQRIAIAITGTAGASGAYELTIARLPDACGDGVCEAGEACDACAADCGSCPPPPVCGDGSCESGEDSTSCASDCPAGPVCGDGICEAGESCSVDCSTTSSYCGDGTCDAGESSASCSSDCGSTSCDPFDPSCV